MFLDYLLKQQTITEFQYNQVLAELESQFGGDTNKALIAVGLSEDALTQAKASYYQLPYKKIDPKIKDPDALHFISEESAKHYNFAPLEFVDGVLSVGITEPENMEAMNALQFISVKQGTPFKMFLISMGDFNQVLEQYKTISEEVDKAVGEFSNELDLANKEVKDNGQKITLTSDDPKKNEKIIEDAPIIKIVAVIINHAVEGGASDIHVENSGEKVNVRYRVDGVLHTTLTLPLSAFDGVVARIKILSKLRLDEKRKPQDGSFATMIENRKIEFRVSTFPAYYGEKVVLRILDSERGVRALEDISLQSDHLAMIKNALTRPYGLILISGPTGSGKSTTLYSMLNAVDKESKNVVSLEDPVEYHMAGVTQSQVLPEIGYTFAAGLRSILRQDPNIIMVGEIRDKETAQLAIQAALTGHLVLSTVHTNTAIGVVPRLIDMGVDPYLIAPTLILSISQRLVRQVHPSAKHQIPMDDVTRELIRKEFADMDPAEVAKLNISNDTMYEVKPSSESPSGMKGRMPVFEMFAVDKDVEQAIIKNPTEPELYKVVRAKGMRTIKEDAILKALKGDIAMQDVFGFN